MLQIGLIFRLDCMQMLTTDG